ncbi:autophagy-related protein 8 [Pyrus x bretschneideri]|uniref:autophagy-related protein 8 n=1 Tax=Pyrus x bretschneideri TaxID=225117 RepID=UPI00202DF95A|nr:autophagy-related protein 8 [Pyrus x bretschneideri]
MCIFEYDTETSDLIPGKIVKKKRIKGAFILSKPISMLDTWNDYSNKELMAQREKAALEGKSVADLFPNRLWESCQEREINPWLLREKKPDHIPVNVKKDPSSKIPNICVKKFHVHCGLPLSEFTDFIRIRIGLKEGLSWEKPLFLYFKNTDPPASTLMYVIDKDNQDDDGCLNITYAEQDKGKGKPDQLDSRTENLFRSCKIPGVTVIPRPIEPLELFILQGHFWKSTKNTL